MSPGQRKISQVPLAILVLFSLLCVMQVVFHHTHKRSAESLFRHLNNPLDAQLYRALSLGSDQLFSYLLLLRVQLHDNQQGRHVNYSHLNYDTLSDWLLTLDEVNPASDYPAFLASRVYSNVDDEKKIRKMVAVIETLFNKNPQLHWRRMTEASLLLKHQLHDLPGALRIAEKIASLPDTISMPFWARDMKLILLDELNQYESAQILISSMLQSGQIKDEDEIRFLRNRLLKIQQSLSENRQHDK